MIRLKSLLTEASGLESAKKDYADNIVTPFLNNIASILNNELYKGGNPIERISDTPEKARAIRSWGEQPKFSLEITNIQPSSGPTDSTADYKHRVTQLWGWTVYFDLKLSGTKLYKQITGTYSDQALHPDRSTPATPETRSKPDPFNIDEYTREAQRILTEFNVLSRSTDNLNLSGIAVFKNEDYQAFTNAVKLALYNAANNTNSSQLLNSFKQISSYWPTWQSNREKERPDTRV
jgi:hypothetical protein